MESINYQALLSILPSVLKRLREVENYRDRFLTTLVSTCPRYEPSDRITDLTFPDNLLAASAEEQLLRFVASIIEAETPSIEPNMLAAAHEALTEAAERLKGDMDLYRQVQAQLEEVDAIIERLRNDRKEIGRLKEETRSNISELQRMIAA
jgi:hypothetical protein